MSKPEGLRSRTPARSAPFQAGDHAVPPEELTGGRACLDHTVRQEQHGVTGFQRHGRWFVLARSESERKSRTDGDRRRLTFVPQEDRRRMPGSPDRGFTGLGVDREELTGDELATRKLSTMVASRSFNMVAGSGCCCRARRNPPMAMSASIAAERSCPMASKIPTIASRSDGVVERVTGHPVRRLQDAGDQQLGALYVSGGSSDQRSSAASETGPLRRVAEMTSP